MPLIDISAGLRGWGPGIELKIWLIGAAAPQAAQGHAVGSFDMLGPAKPEA